MACSEFPTGLLEMSHPAAPNPSVSVLLDPSSQTDEIPHLKRKRSPPHGGIVTDSPLRSQFKEFTSWRLHPTLVKVIIISSIYLGVGTVCFYRSRHHMTGKKTNAVLDAVYFCITTLTTVGYGDIVPNSVATKLFACAFVLTGMALIALGLSQAADFLAEKQGSLLVRALNMNQNADKAEMLKEMESNRVKYKCAMVCLLLVVVVISGTVFRVEVEGLSFIDAFYSVCCNVSFSTEAGRVFGIFWIMISAMSFAQFFLCLSQLYTDRRQQKLVKWVLQRKMTLRDLEAADIDEDGFVGVSDFIIYKLKEIGKINEEDILPVIEEFKQLDVNKIGSIG